MNRRTFMRLSFQSTALAMLQMAAGCKLGGQSSAETVALAPLPYAPNALEPHLSAATLGLHHGKHQRAYVEATNRLAAGTRMAGRPLAEIISGTRGKKDSAALFNNAAQVYNHQFYWDSMAPGGGGAPQGIVADRLAAAFGSYEAFRRDFTQSAGAWFGSGWIWLTADGGSLKIICTANAETPLGLGPLPLLALDLWEHAYYLDYQNRRGVYVEAFLDHLVNWGHAAALLAASDQTA